MKKCTCKDCGETFDYSPAVKSCPNCGSKNIRLVRDDRGNKNWIKKVGIAIAIIVVLILLLKCCKGCGGPITASIDTTGPAVNIKISGATKSRLKEFRIQILCGTEEVCKIGIMPRTATATYDKMRMLEGNCYNFRIVDKNGKPVEVRWNKSPQYCPEALRIPVFADPAFTTEINREKKVYTITIHIADTSNADEFAIEDDWQSSNVFSNIKPGEYIIKAKNSSGVAEQSLYLKDIKELGKPLSMAEVQATIDAVSSGKMTPSAAQDKLADGNVNLKRTIESSDNGTLKTLWGVLAEAEWGTRFRVNGFSNDPNSNKIKSGSLDVSIR